MNESRHSQTHTIVCLNLFEVPAFDSSRVLIIVRTYFLTVTFMSDLHYTVNVLLQDKYQQ